MKYEYHICGLQNNIYGLRNKLDDLYSHSRMFGDNVKLPHEAGETMRMMFKCVAALEEHLNNIITQKD